tara:strand:+ start:499 stop:1209 length:711 start_codon:yes stop_codon:yes gene_type:complete
MKISITKSYTEILDDSHRGKPGFIVGSGASLSGLDLTDIFSYTVFSINSSIMLMPWKAGDIHNRFWVSNDALCMGWSYWDKLMSSRCNKIVRTSWLKHFDRVKDFYFFHPRSTSEGVVDEKDDGLAYCSSVPTSLDIAIKLGINPIFLLGVDHNFPGTNKGSHFWHNFPVKSWPTRKAGGAPPRASQSKVFLYNNMAYGALSGFARHNDIRIFNCNPKSSVNDFEKIEFKDYKKHI